MLHLTRLSIATFDGILKQLVVHRDMARRRKFKSRHPWDVRGPEDHLSTMLIDHRRHITQEFLGSIHRVDYIAICQAIQRIVTFGVPLSGVGRKAKSTARKPKP